jgi:starch synthase
VIQSARDPQWIDLQQYRQNPGVDALVKRGVDPERPFVLFVGGSRARGIIHLGQCHPAIDPAIQVVCASA